MTTTTTVNRRSRAQKNKFSAFVDFCAMLLTRRKEYALIFYSDGVWKRRIKGCLDAYTGHVGITRAFSLPTRHFNPKDRCSSWRER